MEDRVRFEVLEQRWQGALSGRHARERALREGIVGEWRAEHRVMAQRTAELRSQGRWLRGPSDLIGVIGQDRSELLHSTVIAWLLDPTGAHGLGSGLLKRFLRDAGAAPVPEHVLGAAQVRQEVVHPDGRADILVDLAGSRLVIENKIDAIEQPRQCSRMVTAFDGPDASFVFLTATGRVPTTAGGHADRWTTVSYGQLAGWLRKLLEDDERACTVGARDYLGTLERMTG